LDQELCQWADSRSAQVEDGVASLALPAPATV